MLCNIHQFAENCKINRNEIGQNCNVFSPLFIQFIAPYNSKYSFKVSDQFCGYGSI
jgi:hypothetical protein